MRNPRTWLVVYGVAAVFIACAAAGAQQPRPGKAAGRLTPEILKKYDKNGDGQLDATERAAARAGLGRAPTSPATTTPAAPTGETPAAKASQGFKPLTDMKSQDQYKGEDGGLYGGGSNQPPAAHLELALREAAHIVPRGADGKPAPDGKIVLISLGMSNTTAEFSRFVQVAGRAKGAHVVLVDGAQLGRTASEWANPEKSRRPQAGSPWTVLDARLKEAGVTPEQVQAAWIKEAEAFPSNLGEFPKHATVLKDNLATMANLLKQRYPNLRIAYLSSRTYGGYAQSPLCPEPFAYEGAFAVRGVIQAQLAGGEALNCDPSKGPVKAPVLLWGPYLWADGTQPRQADGLTWASGDFREDGTHPSASGVEKVAGMLLKFLQSDPTATAWFAK